MAIDLGKMSKVLSETDPVGVQGRVQAVIGSGILGVVPGVRLGELLEVDRGAGGRLVCEVVGFRDNVAILMPFGPTEGVGLDDAIRPTDHTLSIIFGESLLGRVLDGLGNPIDGGPGLTGVPWAVMRPPPEPMARPRVVRPLALGIRSLDAFVTVGEGQRIGLFAGSGAGKSMLLGQIARQAEADVFVVCLVGERGRELKDFVEDALGPEGRGRGVVVCATSDMPALVRMKSAYVATAIAEGFREQGQRVVLLLDSITRFVRAAREVGLAAGETPARRGYPPSAFAVLPGLLERSGTSPAGSITAFYAVLVEGDDLDEPVSDEVRGILDGHIVLSRELGARGQWPAVDVVSSLSRLMNRVADPEHVRAARAVREHLAVYESKRDLVALGAYRNGSDPKLDAAIARMDRIEAFLGQAPDRSSPFEETVARLRELV